MPDITRTASARVWMTLDGVVCENVKTISGGGISAPVIETPSPEGFTEKHLGPPAYEEFIVDVGLSSAPELYDWLASSWTTSPQPRDGSVVSGDVDGNAKSERPFANALVSGVTVPKLDGSSKDAGYLRVTFRPEIVPPRPASGKLAPSTKPKAWLCSNFRLELDGIDTSRVATIESFTVRNAVAENVVGDGRDLTREPTRPEFPNLVLSASASHAQTWEDWFADFVLNADNSQAKEKSGAIVFLAPDMKTELGRIALHGVGICALRPPGSEPGTEQIARISVELYCERMELHIGAPAPAPTPVPPVVPIRPEPQPRPIVPHR
jgi:hypothetical protein